MNKITLWIMRNSLLGSILNLIFGEGWIEKKPRVASVVKTTVQIIYFVAPLGLIITLFN